MEWKNGELKTNNIRIQVTNKHIHAKGVWVMHVRELRWDTKEIGIPNHASEADAQYAATKKVVDYLYQIINELT